MDQPGRGRLCLTTSGADGAATGVLAGAAGRVDLFPFIPRDAITIDWLSVNVTMLMQPRWARLPFTTPTRLGDLRR